MKYPILAVVLIANLLTTGCGSRQAAVDRDEPMAVTLDATNDQEVRSAVEEGPEPEASPVQVATPERVEVQVAVAYDDTDTTVMVAAAQLCDAFGGSSAWSGQEAVLKLADLELRLAPGAATAYGLAPVALPAPVTVQDGHLMAPLRAVFEALGATVVCAPGDDNKLQLTVVYANRLWQSEVMRPLAVSGPPRVELTKDPGFGEGGEWDMGEIGGRILGLRHPEQYRVVVFSETTMFYVQPWETNYLLPVKATDGSFGPVSIHRGYTYQVLVVRPGFTTDSPRSSLPSGSEVVLRQSFPAVGS